MSTTASDTLDLLEQRLARLEYQLGANPPTNRQSNGTASENVPVTAQLIRLESRVKDLCANNTQAASILRMYKRNAEISSLLDQQQDDTSTMPKDHQTSNVLAAGTLFPQTLSDLTSLESQQVPDARQLAGLVGLQPRIARAMTVQQTQSDQQDELHLRSARLLARWHEQSVVGQGERWADWQDRLSSVEMQLRRKERARQREEEGL